MSLFCFLFTKYSSSYFAAVFSLSLFYYAAYDIALGKICVWNFFVNDEFASSLTSTQKPLNLSGVVERYFHISRSKKRGKKNHKIGQ